MSKNDELTKLILLAQKLVNVVLGLLALVSVLLIYYAVDPNLTALQAKRENIAANQSVDDGIKDGIHIETGLIAAEGLMVVVNNCTNCHSSKLITQNRMSTERWNATIRWMQETQNLWELGDNQEVIVNYLVTNYPTKAKGRREQLSNIEWYELE